MYFIPLVSLLFFAISDTQVCFPAWDEFLKFSKHRPRNYFQGLQKAVYNNIPKKKQKKTE
jgi:hypothetical protein